MVLRKNRFFDMGMAFWGPPKKNYSERARPPLPQRNTIGISKNIRFLKVRVIAEVPPLVKLGYSFTQRCVTSISRIVLRIRCNHLRGI